MSSVIDFRAANYTAGNQLKQSAEVATALRNFVAVFGEALQDNVRRIDPTEVVPTDPLELFREMIAAREKLGREGVHYIIRSQRFHRDTVTRFRNSKLANVFYTLRQIIEYFNLEYCTDEDSAPRNMLDECNRRAIVGDDGSKLNFQCYATILS